MLTIILITVVVFPVAMLITAKGIEKKGKSSIECALSKYCEIENVKQCSRVKETSINYLTMSGKLNEVIALHDKNKISRKKY